MVTVQKYRAYLPILAVLTIALLIGAFALKDYGESWDEADIYRYADYSLGAYRFFFHPALLPPFETNLNLYGPAYYMAIDVTAHLLTRIVPSWSQVDAWHFIYFVTFLGCALCIFFLTRRWASHLGALGAAVLFLSQPLLWGHSFINPKDTPFMALFATTILLGLVMVDRLAVHHRLDFSVIPASIFLGITSSFRVIGPLAGIIVLGYAAYRLRQRVFAMTVAYIGLTAITAYVTWPYLWSSPLSHYAESLHTMAEFPFATPILFEGTLFGANALPRSYFPTLLLLQLTESALIIVAAGIIASILLWRRTKQWQPLGLFLAWFLLPVLIIVGLRTPLYDNGRQLYFVLPPLFILGGIGIDWLFRIFTHPALKGAAVLVLALPGVLMAARLHPYEYVYYNSLVGGTGGAFRKFEMDYWGTSFKELTNRANATVPPASSVLVFGPEQIVARYARPDMKVFIAGERTQSSYDYVMLLTRENLDERRCKKAPTLDEVGRQGAVFAVLRPFRAGEQCP